MAGEYDDNNHVDNTDGDSGVGDVKCPPPIELETSQGNVEKVDIYKVNDFTQTYTVDQITDRAAGNRGHGVCQMFIGSSGIDEIKHEGQNEKR